MATKYLEIDSTYRNRNLWPDPGNFEVLISHSGRERAPLAAQDPVSSAAPVASFTINRFIDGVASSASITGTIDHTGIGNASSPDVIVFTTTDDLQESGDYYKHAVVRSVGTPLEYSRITAYKYLGNNRGQITIDPPLALPNMDDITISDPTDLTDPNQALIFIPSGGDSPQEYLNYFVLNETRSETATISDYDNDTGIATVPNVPTWTANDSLIVAKERVVLITTAIAGTTVSNVVLGAGASTSDGIYTGMFLRAPPTAYDSATSAEVRRIVAYDGSTTTATVDTAFTAISATDTVELLGFSYDNFNPFTYTGSQQHELVAYSIKLSSLVLPNQVLTSGSRIAFYPYVYVELRVLESPASNVIYSNNPNATKMLFRASVENISNLVESPFIKLAGDGMEQVITFKVQTNFKFRVILPDGTLFKTVSDEEFSPMRPNSAIQLSALFEVSRR